MKVLHIVGARPNFMKVGPIHRALEAIGYVQSLIVHTGQHYDQQMSDVFFKDLGLPEPDFYLGVGGGTHAEQTARVMVALEPVLLAEQPDVVLVVGDVNSTIAAALVAAKRHIPVAHVEAGLRSGDRSMPEELNRICTDALSDLLFVTEESGIANLRQEGIPDDKVFFVGNVMIDSLVQTLPIAEKIEIAQRFGVAPKEYVLMTMHRPANVDVEDTLRKIVGIVEQVAVQLPIVFPLHPRTRENLKQHGMLDTLTGIPSVKLVEPLGYIEFLALMKSSAAVITDSGGVQEETTFLGVPCLTLRENTERPVTIDMGTNELAPIEPDYVSARLKSILASDSRRELGLPPLWDGNAAKRIVKVLLEWHRSRA